MRASTTAAGRSRVVVLTLLALLAFAGNSLLCRLALRRTAIDPASFTALRIVSGAVTMALIVRLRGGERPMGGSWASALALFAYAAAFSYAYLTLTAGTGALLLFGAVQATMIGYGRRQGERFGRLQAAGLALAAAGLVGLVLPGLQAPPLQGSLLMLTAGVAWGVYSLRGRGSGDALAATAGNFVRAAVPALALAVTMLPWGSLDRPGAAYAVASGALASGVGYAVWYGALRGLPTASAATIQLSVPMLAALGGIVFLGEPLTGRFVAASIAILGGIALVAVQPASRQKPAPGR